MNNFIAGTTVPAVRRGTIVIEVPRVVRGGRVVAPVPARLDS